MGTLSILQTLGLLGWAAASATPLERYTPEDLLAAPRPQNPIVCPDRRSAIQAVDHWDQETDTCVRNPVHD